MVLLMRPMLAIFALLVAAVGWYYLFYSQAAQRLERVEDQRNNRIRGVLRRVNAIIMLLMAVGIALGTLQFERLTPEQFVLTWAGVMVLLFVVVVLALIDVRLTWKLRRTLRERGQPKEQD
jgi:drug/metabolite transporter (DMT)-like permease